MCWNKGRLCWKIAKLFYFCHLKKLVRPETFWTLLRSTVETLSSLIFQTVLSLATNLSAVQFFDSISQSPKEDPIFHSLKFSPAFSGSQYDNSVFALHCRFLRRSFLAQRNDCLSCPMCMIRNFRIFYCARNYCRIDREIHIPIHTACLLQTLHRTHYRNSSTAMSHIIPLPDDFWKGNYYNDKWNKIIEMKFTFRNSNYFLLQNSVILVSDDAASSNNPVPTF